LRETLKAQEEAIREAITKEKKDKESSKERFVLHNDKIQCSNPYNNHGDDLQQSFLW